MAFDSDAGLPANLRQILRAAGAIDGVALTTIFTVAVTLPPGGINLLRNRPDVVAARPERRLEFHCPSRCRSSRLTVHGLAHRRQ